MRLTTKGQVTVPQDVRRKLGIGPGSEVEIVSQGKVAILRPKKKAAVAGGMPAWIKRATGTANSGLSTDEIMELTRGE